LDYPQSYNEQESPLNPIKAGMAIASMFTSLIPWQCIIITMHYFMLLQAYYLNLVRNYFQDLVDFCDNQNIFLFNLLQVLNQEIYI
jgi:hypothetical protein